MDKTDKYIDDLFRQKFSDDGAVVSKSGDDWANLSKVIRRKNFMRFSPGTFNVYYLSAIAATIITVSSLILPSVVEKRKVEKENSQASFQILDSPTLQKTQIEKPDSIIILELEPVKAKSCLKNTQPQLKNNESKKHYSMQSNENAQESKNLEIKTKSIDSLQNNLDLNCAENTEAPVINRSQSEIVPSDTIIKIDTIRIQKKGVQIRRKKNAF